MLSDKIKGLIKSKKMTLQDFPRELGNNTVVSKKINSNNCRLSFLVTILDCMSCSLLIVDSEGNTIRVGKDDIKSPKLSRIGYQNKGPDTTAAGEKIPAQEKDD